MSATPDFVAQGAEDVLVTFTLDSDATPKLPPSDVDPTNVVIGDIEGTALNRDGTEITATFDIPADETLGAKEVTVSFDSPVGTIVYTLNGGVSVLDDGLPMVTIVATDGSAAEAGPDAGTFTITRTGSTETDLTVALLLGGSATEGDDFESIARTAVIPARQASVALTLTPVDDTVAESSETVTLSISADAAYTTGTSATATVQIADNDGEISSGTYPIVDTGQTTYYNDTTEIFAPSVGDAFYGQDAQYIGNQPSYTVSSDGLTVYDNITELTWTQGADWTGDGTVDVDDKFTFADAQTYVDTLNAQNYGGFSDWRVPTIKELYSLIDYRGTDPNPQATSASGLVPFIDDDVFEFAYGDTSAGERVIDSQWVTSTLYVSTVMNGDTAMFGVNFADGRIKGYPAESGTGAFEKTFYARFCRGNADYGINAFTDNGDGTVTDGATGLMWSQDDSGVGMNWEDALAWVQRMNAENYLGHDDWRLPNAKELQSLVDYTRSPDTTNSAAIDPLFNATQITDEAGQADYPFYWSSTTFLRFNGSADRAVYVAFGEGLGSMDDVNVIDVHGAGCQRSDPKDGDPNDYPNWGNGPQGDVQRVFNFVRLVRDADTSDQNVSPTAEAGGPYSGQPDTVITLDASGSTDADGTVVSYEWDLDNDGQYGDATGQTASFTASAIGTYTVGLRVTDDGGAQTTDTATVSVAEQGEPFEGYNLFSSLNSTTVYLMDNVGTIVHSWATDYTPGLSTYLLGNGELLHTGNVHNTAFDAGGAGGTVQTIDWDGNVTWEYEYSSTSYLQHHDVEMLPNGNVLLIAWQYKSGTEATAAGRDPTLINDGELWPDSIVEVQPTGPNTGQIVWEWNVWDHLVQDQDSTKSNYGVVADHPELIDVNYALNGGADWTHVNSIDYNAELDQIVLSVHNFNEIWIIDHSTTTEEAAGHSGGDSGMGGDLLYRWGNPQTYDAGTAADQELYAQHDAEWIETGLPGEGDTLIFNNGLGRLDGNYSSVVEIATPVNSDGNYSLVEDSAYGPDQPVWTYAADVPSDFYAQNISGAQRLPNGNTLICNGPDSYFFEVTASGETVWQYDATGQVFQVHRYAPDFSGFDGTPLDDDPANQAPVADAGGPYSVNAGENLLLDGTGSFDPDAANGDSIVSYEWDIEGDGSYEYTGAQPQIAWAELAALPQPPETIPIVLRVTDKSGSQSIDTGELTILGTGVNVYVIDRTLFVQGSSGNDSLTFARGDTDYTVNINGQVSTYAAAEIDDVVFYGEAGNDAITSNGTSGDEKAEMWSDHAVFSGSLAVDFSWTGVEVVTANMCLNDGTDRDLLTMYGTDSTTRESLVASSYSATYHLANGVTLVGTGYESLEVHSDAVDDASGAGDDAAILTDGWGDDTFTSDPSGSTFSGEYKLKLGEQTDGTPILSESLYTFELKLFGFPNTLVKASYGGTDTAIVHDSAGNDELLSYRPAKANPSVDLTVVYDVDHAAGSPYNYLRKLYNFENVVSIADQGGTTGEVAIMHDRPSDDVLTASPTSATFDMFAPDGVTPRTVTATGYKIVNVYAANGGYDTADLTDSSEYDEVITRSDFTILYSPDESTSDPVDNEWAVRAKGFEYTKVHSTYGGNDKAYFFDSTGDDVFNATSTYSEMYGLDGSYYNKVDSFNQVAAFSTKAGTDVAYLYDSAYADVLTSGLSLANADRWAQMESDTSSPLDYYFHIRGFEETHATYDSSQDDVSGIDPDSADWFFASDSGPVRNLVSASRNR